MTRNRTPLTLFAPLSLVLAAGLLAGVAQDTLRPTMAQAAPPAALERIADAAEAVLPAVVNISTTRTTTMERSSTPFGADPFFRQFFGDPEGGRLPQEFRERSGGSGVIVDASGIVLTNNHVIAGADEVTVTLSDGREMLATVIGSDPRSDLAVIRLEGNPKDLRALPLGNSDELRLGGIVLAVGNPFGLSGSVTMGIVSATGRARGIVDYEDFIQTDAAINPGNSGGALVNLDGELVGINTAILSRSGGYQGIGFAIPSNMAAPIMDSLIKKGRVDRAWLGVYIQDLDPDLAAGFGLTSTDGVLVSDIADQSPAAAAGVKAGDIITGFDGDKVATASDLRNRVAVQPAGKRAQLDVLRDGKNRSFTVKLGELPGEKLTSVAPARDEGPLVGVELGPLDDGNRRRFDIADDVEGVVVTGVQVGSPGFEAGLRAGDVIVELDRKRVTSVPEFDGVYSAKSGSAVLRVLRDGSRRYLVLKK